MEEDNFDLTYIVTQFINPNYFFCFNPHLRDDLAREQLEKNLENEIKKLEIPGAMKIFKKNETVAYYWTEGKRFIRCQIDDIREFNQLTTYFLYAIDYGVSLYSTKVQDIYAVSETVKFSKTSIMDKVSLAVLPIITRFDFIENKERVFYHDKWGELALKIFQQSLNKAATITFEVSNQKYPTGHKGFLFGDLKITTFYGMVMSLSDILVEAKVAKYPKTPQEFILNFDKLMTRDIERWNDNDKTGGILKLDEGKFPLYYEDEILMKQYISNCETVQNRVLSVQKVLEWQNKIRGFEHFIPGTESDMSTDEDWDNPIASQHDDEGFDEKVVKSKPILLSKFGVMKMSKPNDRDKMSTFSGVSKSVSQNNLVTNEKN